MGGTWLSKDEISLIRKKWSTGRFTKKELAEEFEVTLSCISTHVKDVERVPNPPCEDGEVWRGVNGYEDSYLVSNYGRVYKTPGSPADHKLLHISIDAAGHPTVSIYKDGVRKSIRVQLLVVYAFTDADPNKKIIVKHLDGNVKNNRIDNLEWSYRPIRHPYGQQKTPCERKSKKSLSEAEARDVQEKWLEGKSQGDLAREYNVSIATVFNQIKGLKRDFVFPDSEPGEGWREIEGYEGRYLISSHGRLYLTGFGRRDPKMATQTIGHDGYYGVRLTNADGDTRSFQVHRLVAAAFCDGRSKERNVVNHKDGNKKNNHASNLEWCTIAENTRHAIDVLGMKSGGNDQISKRTMRTVERNTASRPSPLRKFTDAQVKEIRSDPRSSWKVAEEYGVNKCTIQNIRSGKTYKNI